MRSVLAILFIAMPLAAEAMPQKGATLPNLVISGDDNGLMKISGKDIEYRTFNSGKVIPGKVRAVIYMAGRGDAKKKGQKFINALKKAKPPRAKFTAITIMDLDDCTFGTCGIAKGRLEDRQRAKPFYQYVADEDGKGRKKWRLKKEDFTVFITDEKGTIIDAARGSINSTVAKRLTETIMQAIAPPAAAPPAPAP